MARLPLTTKSIITAAADLADRDGFDAIVVSTVARKLDVQTASLYGHIRDRAAILDGVQELAMGELAEAIGAEIAGRAGHDALVGLGEAQRTYAKKSPGRWESLQRPVAAGVAQSESTLRLVWLTVAVLRGYALSDEDVVHAARMLGAMVNGFIALERTGSFDHRAPETEVSWQRALNALDTVFRSWAAATSGGNER